MKRALIVGATSGIGRELAIQLSAQGVELGLTGRRTALLETLQRELPSRSVITTMDVADADSSRSALSFLLTELGDTDVIVLNAGVSGQCKEGDWEPVREVIDINARGFAALALIAYDYFKARNGGQLVGISSVASQVPSGTYSASKAFISSFMQGLRGRAASEGWTLDVTDIRPGFIHTPMTERLTSMFWTVDVTYATRQMVSAIRRKSQRSYVPKRWWLIHALTWLLPYRFFNRVS